MVGRADLIRQPLLLMHGTDDPVVPVAQSRALRDTLYASGVEVRYTEFEEGHGLRNPNIDGESTNWSVPFCMTSLTDENLWLLNR